MATFTVDTHLFRELGELLVGRDSTALVELVKNAYDADATEVTVHGEHLDQPGYGRILITDDGGGMTRDQFERGFLRIASRIKEEGERRSALYGRRFTGAKGVGRLAAHKLARLLNIESVPRADAKQGVAATIDWDVVEEQETLDQIGKSGAVRLTELQRRASTSSSTVIELKRLRRKWTPGERTRLFAEIGTFRPPQVLVSIPPNILDEPSLIDELEVADVRDPNASTSRDPGFSVELTGEFAAGEDYWHSVAEAASWLVEIRARKGKKVQYAVTATRATRSALRQEGLKPPKRQDFELDHPAPKEGPFFDARVLVREGQVRGEQRNWVGQQSGIRVYMEGFRVLPYGEPSDDWLEIDADYNRRERTLRFLDAFEGAGADEDEGLLQVTKRAYFGAVFLTQQNAASLQMLVNREGFVPDASYDRLKRLLRVGIDLSVRRRAAVRLPLREKRRRERSEAADSRATVSRRVDLKVAVEEAVARAADFARQARLLASRGDVAKAVELIEAAAKEFREGSDVHERLLSERGMLRILAGVGLQMAAFVHEINGLLGMTQVVEQAIERIQNQTGLTREVRHLLAQLRARVEDLRRVVERQASYLTDITSPDARRRRSRQKLADRFEAASRLVRPALERRRIDLENSIPEGLKSRPMFPAEIMVVFSNLLTNAAKAAGEDGRIRATGVLDSSGAVVVRVENTGTAIDLDEAERWFLPFETTTAESDPVLGQGMGMGLPIARNMLEEYGGEIRFVKPSRGFATAVELRFGGGAT